MAGERARVKVLLFPAAGIDYPGEPNLEIRGMCTDSQSSPNLSHTSAPPQGRGTVKREILRSLRLDEIRRNKSKRDAKENADSIRSEIWINFGGLTILK